VGEGGGGGLIRGWDGGGGGDAPTKERLPGWMNDAAGFLPHQSINPRNLSHPVASRYLRLWLGTLMQCMLKHQPPCVAGEEQYAVESTLSLTSAYWIG
jgi:hypothetical protein